MLSEQLASVAVEILGTAAAFQQIGLPQRNGRSLMISLRFGILCPGSLIPTTFSPRPRITDVPHYLPSALKQPAIHLPKPGPARTDGELKVRNSCPRCNKPRNKSPNAIPAPPRQTRRRREAGCVEGNKLHLALLQLLHTGKLRSLRPLSFSRVRGIGRQGTDNRSGTKGCVTLTPEIPTDHLYRD
jgi:hypothetical protein